MIMTMHEKLVALLVEKALHTHVDVQLSSGERSDMYLDCRQWLALPSARSFLGSVVNTHFYNTVRSMAAIGGMAISAYPVAIAITDGGAEGGSPKDIPAFVIRQETRHHGLARQIEGIDCEALHGKEVLVVDDVATTGRSLCNAITACRAHGLVVTKALVIVERDEQSRKAVEERGVELIALCHWNEIRAAVKG